MTNSAVATVDAAAVIMVGCLIAHLLKADRVILGLFAAAGETTVIGRWSNRAHG